MNTNLLLTPRNKLILLGLAFLCLVLSAYHFSFSKTLALHEQLTQNEARLQQVKDLPLLIREYEALLSDTNHMQQNASYNREALFEKINTFCRVNKLQLEHFYPEQRMAVQHFDLITNKLEVQGSFKDMVRLGWFIEREERLGHIASVSYKTMDDKRTGKTWLTGTFFIQHYFQHAPNKL